MKKVVEQCETKVPVYGGIVDPDELKKNLAMHCIPEKFVKMNLNDYQDFLEKRRVLMAKKIQGYYESL